MEDELESIRAEKSNRWRSASGRANLQGFGYVAMSGGEVRLQARCPFEDCICAGTVVLTKERLYEAEGH